MLPASVLFYMTSKSNANRSSVQSSPTHSLNLPGSTIKFMPGSWNAREEAGRDRKPSRFGFVNAIRNKLDEKAERAMRETMEYQAQKAAQKDRKNQKKKQNRR